MHILKGHYRKDGGALEVGTLMVERNGDRFIEAESGFRLHAAQYAITSELTGVEITSPDALLAFVPAAGECERIGMAVA